MDGRSKYPPDMLCVVEKILAKRSEQIITGEKRTEYLVKWAGYDESENCWLPKANFNPVTLPVLMTAFRAERSRFLRPIKVEENNNELETGETYVSDGGRDSISPDAEMVAESLPEEDPIPNIVAPMAEQQVGEAEQNVASVSENDSNARQKTVKRKSQKSRLEYPYPRRRRKKKSVVVAIPPVAATESDGGSMSEGNGISIVNPLEQINEEPVVQNVLVSESLIGNEGNVKRKRSKPRKRCCYEYPYPRRRRAKKSAAAGSSGCGKTGSDEWKVASLRFLFPTSTD